MFTLNFISQPQFSYNQKVVDEIVRNISKVVHIAQNGTLNLVFLDPDSIKNLNNIYRKKDTPTDVLSFHYFEDFSDVAPDDIAGEIVFCEEKIVSQWIEYGLGSEKEFYKLLIHSLLHILGYDHENDDDYEAMSIKEEKIWESIFKAN